MNDLQQRVIRALALKAMESRFGETTLYPEDLANIDYQLMLKPLSEPTPRVVVTLITRERFNELVKQGAPIV